VPDDLVHRRGDGAERIDEHFGVVGTSRGLGQDDRVDRRRKAGQDLGLGEVEDVLRLVADHRDEQPHVLHAPRIRPLPVQHAPVVHDDVHVGQMGCGLTQPMADRLPRGRDTGRQRSWRIPFGPPVRVGENPEQRARPQQVLVGERAFVGGDHRQRVDGPPDGQPAE
jgi:hypothetical protein